jgi:hypothetical protein
MDGQRTSFAPMEPSREPAVAALLVAAVPGLTPDGARRFLAALAADPDATVVAAFDGDAALVMYVLRKVGVASELLLVAADPAADPARGLEAAAVRDAGERVGRRPLTVETNERVLAWYQGLGFKLVGKRRKPDGSWGYRLGWHGRREGLPVALAGAGDGADEACPDPGALLGAAASAAGSSQ